MLMREQIEKIRRGLLIKALNNMENLGRKIETADFGAIFVF